VVTGRVTSGRDRCWSGRCGGCGLDDLLRVRDLELGEQVALGLGELGGLPERAGGAGEGAQGEQVHLVGDRVPGRPPGRLQITEIRRCRLGRHPGRIDQLVRLTRLARLAQHRPWRQPPLPGHAPDPLSEHGHGA